MSHTEPNQSTENLQMRIAEQYQTKDAWYPNGTPQSIAQQFATICRDEADHPFPYIDKTPAITYQTVWEQARAYAKSFLHFGVKQQDHIALVMEKDAHYPSLMIATALVGAVAEPIEPTLSQDALANALHQSEARYVFFHETVKARDMGAVIRDLWYDQPFRATSALEQFICLADSFTMPDMHFLDFIDFCSKATSIPDTQLDARWR